MGQSECRHCSVEVGADLTVKVPPRPAPGLRGGPPAPPEAPAGAAAGPIKEGAQEAHRQVDEAVQVEEAALEAQPQVEEPAVEEPRASEEAEALDVKAVDVRLAEDTNAEAPAVDAEAAEALPAEALLAEVEGPTACEGGRCEEKPRGAEGRARIGWRQWSNLVAYAANLGITYVSITGLWGATNTEMSAKYQTLVTPSGWAFSIWGLIFVGEFVAVVVQFLPRYRGRPVVLALTPWWLAACAFQIAWTFAFAQEVIWLSVVLMLGILGCLAGMAVSADFVPLTACEYWLLRAPFAVHLGWIVCATAVNVNVLADASRAEPAALLATAALSLCAVLLVAALFALLPRRPEPIVALVAAWALTALNSELGAPERLDSSVRYNPYVWSRVTLSALRFAAAGMAIAAGALAAVAVALRLVRARRSRVAWREDRSLGRRGRSPAAARSV